MQTHTDSPPEPVPLGADGPRRRVVVGVDGSVGARAALVGMAARIRELLTEVRSDPAVRGVPGAGAVDAQVLAVQGAAAQVLVDAAGGAELLVVGSRGRGAVRSALLGSVALHCVTHAPCPVLVVHGQQRPPRRVGS